MRSVSRTRHRGRLLQATLLAALTSLAGLGLMATSGWLLARAAEHPAASALTLAAVCVRALGLGRGVLRYGERLAGHDAVLRAVADLRVDLFARLRHAPVGFRTGAAASALGRDVEGLQDLWLRGLVPWTAAGVVAVTAAAGAAVVLPAAGAGLAVGLSVAVLLVPYVGWRTAAALEDLAPARARHAAAVTDLLHGSADLLTSSGTRGALEAVERASDELDRLALRRAAPSAGLSAAVVLAQGLTTAWVAWAASRAVLAGDLPRVWVVVLALGSYAAFEPAAGLVDAARAVRSGRAALRRVAGLGTGSVQEEPPPAAPAAAAGLQARGLGLVRAERPVPALRGVDLDLLPGSVLAVVGGSGAGKSTLLQLLAGLAVPTEGAVQLDGADPAGLSQRDRPRHVVLVEQDAHVFDASLRDNLRVGAPRASDEELEQALRTVGLDGWRRRLAQGLDTPLGHRGSRLSGGQRRRLAVARGLLAPAPVLLLDEPTEGLAPDEADRLVADVLAACPGRSVVLVTHRLACLSSVDEVVVLERGAVVQRGSLPQLLELPGLVRDAWPAQRENLLAAT